MDVRFQNVTKMFGSTRAVDELTLTVEDGEFVVLLGPSGCGKTTTLRLLAGLETVTSGRMFIGPTCVNDLSPRERDVAMVFQNYALYPHMTVAENIAYPLRIRKLDRREINRRVQSVAEMLELESLLDRRPRELSGGQRQRVALARAIVREPRVYLMDEPLSNLDAKLRVQMRGELKRLQYELGTTTLYVTHDQAEAMTLAHRIAVMKDGRLQQFDTPLNIYHRPANRFVAGFVGSPSMNFIEGMVDDAEGCFTNGDLTVPLTPEQRDRLPTGRRLTLGVRPEDIRLSPEPEPGWFPATVYVAELMGNETYVFLKLGKERVVARTDPTFQPEIEATVWATFQATKLHFFEATSGERIG
ncbi:MAG: sn-glycerol-3-phosphate ABC transporter ATP-binding protein UgpC [Acidobacteria bacterium]|nr:MAG: sn-glycerol-3-phosphate ABC transporter ATP-binding protein UgpC [Acidobacteriota bacterium]